MEVLAATIMIAAIAIPMYFFLKELYELERIQKECLEIQRDTNRRWDIINKHACELNNELTRIYEQHKNAREE